MLSLFETPRSHSVGDWKITDPQGISCNWIALFTFLSLHTCILVTRVLPLSIPPRPQPWNASPDVQTSRPPIYRHTCSTPPCLHTYTPDVPPDLHTSISPLRQRASRPP